jgi:hypothetical protein
MSGSQMILVIGGLILFSILVINVNSSVTNMQSQTNSSEYFSEAADLAQNMINRISSKAFDQHTLSDSIVTDVSTLTPAASLGPESGETLSTYNDVDDFNNYTETDTTTVAGIFHLKVKVNYVSDNNFNTVLYTQSLTKRIQVAVTSPYMLDNRVDNQQDTLKLNYYKIY